MSVLSAKKKVLFWTSCIAAAALTACLCIFLVYPSGSAEKAEPLATWEEWTVVRGVPAFSERTVTITRDQWLSGALMLVSPQHPLPADYPSPDARSVYAVVRDYFPAEKDVVLRDEVIYALCNMQLDHSLTDQAIMTRGLLSAAQQEALRREAFSRYAAAYPITEAVEKAAAAVPGGNESEHQTGYAVDLVLTGPLSMKEKNPLARSEAGRWIEANAWRYGLIQRYAPGQASEGSCEGIHLRCVGPAHAAAMRALSLDLEEYLLFLHRETALTLLRGGTPYAYILCVPARDALTFSLPERAAFAVSGDNMGYVVMAIAAQLRF